MAACPESKQEVGGQELLTAAFLNPIAIFLVLEEACYGYTHTVICVHVKLEGDICWFCLSLMDVHDIVPVEHLKFRHCI